MKFPTNLLLFCLIKHVFRLCLFILLLSLQNLAIADKPLTPVTLQLHWYHQFQFAGYYAAQAQGYYEEAGLAVTIRDGGNNESGNTVQPEEEVVFNRAQFGTTQTNILINHSRGLPLVVVANIMQHSPFILLSTKRYAFNRLEGIGYERPVTLNIDTLGNHRVDAEAIAALNVSGIEINRLNNSLPTRQLDDLLKGKTHLIPAYNIEEPFFILKAGRVPVPIEPIKYGIDFYGDLLFTSQNMLDQKPEIVAKFRAASMKGWQFAMQHPHQVIDTIVEQYQTRNPEYDREFLIYQAEQMNSLLRQGVIEIGYINQNRWQKIAQTYKSLGLINDVNLDGFLYDTEQQDFWRAHEEWIDVIILAFIIALAIIIYLYVLTSKLNKEIKKRQLTESKLKLQAQLDGLTGIDNRYIFDRNLQREFDRSRRHNQPLALLMIDIDDFKKINDQHGHLTGDEVLRSFVSVSKTVLRNSDFFARLGGEEFAVLLPATRIDEAVSTGERILRNNRDITFMIDGQSINYTVSIGAAELIDRDRSARELMKRTDKMLYQAKKSGKNCISQ